MGVGKSIFALKLKGCDMKVVETFEFKKVLLQFFYIHRESWKLYYKSVDSKLFITVC